MKKKLQKQLATRAAFTLAGTAAAMIASSLTRRALEAGWKAASSKRPPRRPNQKDASWTSALLWTAGSAAIISMASMAAEHGSRRAVSRLTGRQEPRS